MPSVTKRQVVTLWATPQELRNIADRMERLMETARVGDSLEVQFMIAGELELRIVVVQSGERREQ